MKSTRFVLLPGGLLRDRERTSTSNSNTDSEAVGSLPAPAARRRLTRGMLQAFATGRRAGGRALNPRFGL